MQHLEMDRAVSAVMDASRDWLASEWARLLPDEATWIYLLAATEGGRGLASLRSTVGAVDPEAVGWLEQPVDMPAVVPGAAAVTNVEELGELMLDLGLLRCAAEGWRAEWPLPPQTGGTVGYVGGVVVGGTVG